MNDHLDASPELVTLRMLSPASHGFSPPGDLRAGRADPGRRWFIVKCHYNDGANPLRGWLPAADGNVYDTTSQGGAGDLF